MPKRQMWLSVFSAAIVLAGGSILSTPAPAAASEGTFACSALQTSYLRTVGSRLCGGRTGTVYADCGSDGVSVQFRGVSCDS